MSRTGDHGAAPSARVTRALEVLAFAVPFFAFLLEASETSGFLDEGEFVAQGVSLGISHPPGQPLPGLLFGLATLLPWGSMALRVSLVSGLATATASVFLFRASSTLSEALGPSSALSRGLVALAVAFLGVLGPAAVLQAVRPEVYALAALFLAVAMERLTRHAVWGEPYALVGAALAIGLAASCHPYMALLVLVAALFVSASALIDGHALFFRCLGALALGLTPLLYLPLRALREPALNLGDPSTLEQFFWVVAARPFQKNQGEAIAEPGGDRALDVVLALGEALGPVTIVLALGGAYLSFRSERMRRAASILLAVAVLTAAGRAWLGFVRFNPDALGYLLPSIHALALLAGAFVAILLGAIPDELRGGSILSAGVALVLAGLTLARGVEAIAEGGRRDFHEADLFDEEMRRRLPSDAILFAYGPQTIFRHWGFEAEERSRPDVLLVPVPLLFYPGMVEGLLEAEPKLRDVLRSIRLTGSFGAEEIQSLASERPVLIELDPSVEPELFSLFVPDGVLHRVMGEGATSEDVVAGRATQLRTMHRLRARLGPMESIDARAKEALLLRLYNQALFFAAVGERDAATFSTRDALLFAPESPELFGLFEALGAGGSGPIDITPFRIR
jgi:hypothetical protein